MQLNLVQFLGALLTPGYTQGMSVDAGIVTLESGDTFDVKTNAQQLQTLLMSASVDLKDAHEQMVQFVSNQPEDAPYYHETREQLLEVRRGLEALNLGVAAAPASTAVEANILVSLDGGASYRTAPNGVRIIYDKVDVVGEDAPGQVHINATAEGLITDVWVSRDEHLDHNIGTSSNTLEGIVSDLVEDGA